MASIASYKNTARKQALWSQAGNLKRRKVPEFGLLLKWAMRDPALLRAAFEPRRRQNSADKMIEFLPARIYMFFTQE